MSKLRVNAFAVSLDGYGAGPELSFDHPMGVGGMALHQWVLGTRTFARMHADFAGDQLRQFFAYLHEGHELFHAQGA